MTLGIRKLVVLVLVALIFVLANLWLVVGWLAERGVVDWAQHVRSEYLTGTAITVVIALLILLATPRSTGHRLLRRCPVCDHVLLGRGTYCSDCGSKT